MKIVLGASVAVAAARPREPLHRVSRVRVERILAGSDEIVVPTLFSIEVAASLARVGAPVPAIRDYVGQLLAVARVVQLGAVASRQARETAMRWKLRAADSIYVWLAARENLALCTLDREMAERAGGACALIDP